MISRASGFALLAAIMLLAPGASQARDYCLTFPDVPTFILVGQGFTVPAKGKCKPWTGFDPENSTNDGKTNGPSVGTGCTSSDGSHLNLTITTSSPEDSAQPGQLLIDSITLSLPTQTGNDNETSPVSDGFTFGSASVNGGHCSKTIQIPAIEAPQGQSRFGLIHDHQSRGMN